MILILADSTDPWATLVHREAQRTGGEVCWVEPLRLLDQVLLNWPVAAGESVVPGSLDLDGRTMPLDDLTGIFARLPFPLRLDLEGLSDLDAGYVTKEATAAWLAFLNGMPCSVINRPVPGGRPTLLSGSPLLAKIAQDHGVLFPASRCTSSQADALQQFKAWGESAYLKPLGSTEPGQFLQSHDGVEQIRQVMEQQAVSLQMVPLGQQATVYVVGEHVAATVLRPGEAVSKPMEVLSAHATQCLRLVRALGLVFAECQIVITPDGDSYCLDVSSAPNFWRCPQDAQQQIVAHLFEHLSERRSLSQHDSSHGADGRSSTRERLRPTRSPER
ncbi:hypothetical protein [Nitrospira lenta]|uniref:ATP-grasp domain-containing protein n=1 Tax=Nitrospira lenta TaxID=1436998 RepID=A0A330LCJ9_9BACT|nr:hypothetical protein [Nitrospira lenta]SPP66703.1 hypothetical protein NITLEN_80131 [Nitrospira lenta]